MLFAFHLTSARAVSETEDNNSTAFWFIIIATYFFNIPRPRDYFFQIACGFMRHSVLLK